MKKQKFGRSIVLAATILCLFVAAAYGQQADKKGKKEFQFKGTVEKVDANAKTIVVKNENIPGWMNSMSMSSAPASATAWTAATQEDTVPANAASSMAGTRRP